MIILSVYFCKTFAEKYLPFNTKEMENTMLNLNELEKTLPVAPLKIAALDSCKDLAQKVNDYIVDFRHTMNETTLNPALFSKHVADN